MRHARWWTGVLLGWALMFGDDRRGWREVANFGSDNACEHERQDRAREVRDKSVTQPPIEQVLRLYKCQESEPAKP